MFALLLVVLAGGSGTKERERLVVRGQAVVRVLGGAHARQMGVCPSLDPRSRILLPSQANIAAAVRILWRLWPKKRDKDVNHCQNIFGSQAVPSQGDPEA